MTAPADWLSGERPPLPRRERPVIFDAEFADRFESATLELPVWPSSSGELDAPTAEFRPVKPRRWSRQWLRENLSFSRMLWGGASAVVLVATGLGWLQ